MGPAVADETQVARGKYLVSLGGCNDSHTPGYFLGAPDMARYLGGSDVGFEVPGLGVFLGRNLTPDKATGLGDWSDEEIAKAINAIVAFLRSTEPVANDVPGPFGPGETVPTFIMRVLPPGQTAANAPG